MMATESSYIALMAVLALTAALLTSPAPAEEAGQPTPDYGQMLRELKPRMMFEVTEPNLNAYLRAHPEDFAIPEGFSSPHVAFTAGLVEVSALTKVLFVPTRVRVSMNPEVMRGRLRLKVHSVHAGVIPLPASFHRGAADTIAAIINGMLDRNDLQLECVEIQRGLIRAVARVQPAAPSQPSTQQ